MRKYLILFLFPLLSFGQSQHTARTVVVDSLKGLTDSRIDVKDTLKVELPMSIGGAIEASALLTMNSTTKGFRPPEMNTTERDAIGSPDTGLIIENTDSLNQLEIFDGSNWIPTGRQFISISNDTIFLTGGGFAVLAGGGASITTINIVPVSDGADYIDSQIFDDGTSVAINTTGPSANSLFTVKGINTSSAQLSLDVSNSNFSAFARWGNTGIFEFKTSFLSSSLDFPTLIIGSGNTAAFVRFASGTTGGPIGIGYDGSGDFEFRIKTDTLRKIRFINQNSFGLHIFPNSSPLNDLLIQTTHGAYEFRVGVSSNTAFGYRYFSKNGANNADLERFRLDNRVDLADNFFDNINALGINETSPAAMLDINAKDATSGNFAFVIQDNVDSEIFEIRNDNVVFTHGLSVYDEDSVTLGAAVTTFVITSESMTITGDGGANTIATLTGGITGEAMFVTLLFNDALVTITDDNTGTVNTINLSASFTSTANDIIVLKYNGNSYFEISRSIN